MRSIAIRLVHRDETVRESWREALAHLPASIICSEVSDPGTLTPGDIIVIGETGEISAVFNQIRAFHAACPGLRVIFVAAESSEELAIAAIKSGVSDYVYGSSLPDALTAATARLVNQPIYPHCQTPDLASEITVPSQNKAPGETQAFVEEHLVGEGIEMRRIRTQIRLAAVAGSTVLVTGESGTGKELAARTLHTMSGRAGQMVTLNCAAIPDSLLESELFGYERGAFTGAYRSEPGKLAQAEGGTLFLDEIGEMSLIAQVKLLRVIETKEVQRLGSRRNSRVNVRVLAATNRKLEDLVAQGRFRDDLYYRLNVVEVHMSPLRDRMEDLPLLISHYVGVLNAQFHQNVSGIDQQARECMSRYSWPGNIRELRNVLEAAYVSQPIGILRFANLPEHFRHKSTLLRETPGAMSERQLLLSTLDSTQWNKSRAAEKLQWSRVTLYRKLAKYGITDPSRA